MNKERNVALARACYEAYVTKDRSAIEPLIAPDFHFTSPLDHRINRVTYFKRCWPNSATILTAAPKPTHSGWDSMSSTWGPLALVFS